MPVFRAQDERFPYRYTSYAASGSPVALFAFSGGRFVDVTRDHPAAVRKDARDWWATTCRAGAAATRSAGVFAAWAADACLLGNRAKVEARLADGVRLGLFAPPRAETFGPYGQKYATALLRDLVQLGYCRPG